MVIVIWCGSVLDWVRGSGVLGARIRCWGTVSSMGSWLYVMIWGVLMSRHHLLESNLYTVNFLSHIIVQSLTSRNLAFYQGWFNFVSIHFLIWSPLCKKRHFQASERFLWEEPLYESNGNYRNQKWPDLIYYIIEICTSLRVKAINLIDIDELEGDDLHTHEKI